ncbi:hypothetical protein [Metabacillus hrfriensis]|uniref:Uncharacterized protein n=1 Tax=Metabacillus hrfriensis TaxID=3048891 RepID=A0ACD4RA55_9BACI|nr:hypothetical protein [Metabacillus sp. CT-WN-B3]WHZ57373.1 hypothetical protein QLQ22_22430 [Metabacillus sp. CT-WN-B3]
MKKLILIFVLSIIIVFFGLFSFFKINPPLVSGTVGSTMDNKAVVVAIGNKGFGKLKINEVLVNNYNKPLKQKIQVTNPLKGFVISNTFDEEEYGISNIEAIDIESDTSPITKLEKMNNGKATINDKSYGISVVHNEPIEKVNISYSYFGLKFEETVSINNP